MEKRTFVDVEFVQKETTNKKKKEKIDFVKVNSVLKQSIKWRLISGSNEKKAAPSQRVRQAKKQNENNKFYLLVGMLISSAVIMKVFFLKCFIFY